MTNTANLGAMAGLFATPPGLNVPPELTAVAPAQKSVTTTGPWQLTCTGHVPGSPPDDTWKVVIVDPSGDHPWESLDITDVGGGTFLAHYTEAPTSPEATGVGTVELRHGTEVIGDPLAWEWTA
jgi:hypothetical protein